MEIEVFKELVKKYKALHSTFMTNAETGKEYYRNRTAILNGGAKTDDDGNPIRNADNRIPRNFHGLLVNQKASYAFTSPPLFDIGNDMGNKKITETLGDEYADNCMQLCIDSANTSIGWIHYWIDDKGFQYSVVDSEQVIPVWDKGLKTKLIGVLRCYQDTDDDTGEQYEIYEYWTDTDCQAYRMLTNNLETLDYYYMFVDPDDQEQTANYKHGFEEVPFIPFKNNNIGTSDLINIKPLIDVYDKVFSGFINDLDDVQQLIFVLSGYGGTDLNGFLQDLKKYKVISLDEDAEGNPGVSTLNIEIPIEARNSVLTATRKAIFEQGQGYDPQPESFGNQSGEALKFMYSLLEMKVGFMQVKFEPGFAKLVRAICKYNDIACGAITQTWTRTSIRNDTEQAQICKDSVGIVSKRTILANHPLVENVDAELKQLEEEEKEAQAKSDLYREAFGGELVDDNKDGGEDGEES